VGNDIYVVHPHFADEDPPSVERVTFQWSRLDTRENCILHLHTDQIAAGH
jgi:hypothetical protein